MSVNFNSTYFQSFVNFAQQRFDAGAKKAVISASVNNPLQERSILNCASRGPTASTSGGATPAR